MEIIVFIINFLILPIYLIGFFLHATQEGMINVIRKLSIEMRIRELSSGEIGSVLAQK